MKRVFIGLAAGLLLSGVAGFIAIPKVQQSAYNKGYNAGDAQGMEDGTAAGISQGISQIQIREQHERDSALAFQRSQAAIHHHVHKPHVRVLPVQNWHVIDNKIADPIVDKVRS